MFLIVLPLTEKDSLPVTETLAEKNLCRIFLVKRQLEEFEMAIVTKTRQSTCSSFALRELSTF